MKVAALYVLPDGPYAGLPDVDLWDEARDARKYAGPYPVVAHPPCARWGSFATGGLTAKARFRVGDDGGCFAAALAAVRKFGGVLEHPAGSKAWRAFGLTPPHGGAWLSADFEGGWTCRVEQGHFGFRARKPTWLYAVGCELPSLPWGDSEAPTLESMGYKPLSRGGKGGTLSRNQMAFLPRRERASTPPAFRDLLLSMARSVYQTRDAA